MKEVRQTGLNTITGIHKILLPANAKILEAIYYEGLTLVYETEKTTSKMRLDEFAIHVIASFDFVPDSCKYLGTVRNPGNSVVHVFEEC